MPEKPTELIFLEFIIKSLVDKPDEIKIDRKEDARGVLMEVEVATEDAGKIIGKNGQTAASIRTLLRTIGSKQKRNVSFKILN